MVLYTKYHTVDTHDTQDTQDSAHLRKLKGLYHQTDHRLGAMNPTFIVPLELFNLDTLVCSLYVTETEKNTKKNMLGGIEKDGAIP